jgi:hypothetical protein
MGVLVDGDDAAGESCVKENRHDDHGMDSALDEPQNERPSAIPSRVSCGPHEVSIDGA